MSAYACVPDTLEEKDVLDAAVGMEYNANDKYQMSFEISNRYILSDTSRLLPDTDKNSLMWLYRNEDRVGLEIKFYF